MRERMLSFAAAALSAAGAWGYTINSTHPVFNFEEPAEVMNRNTDGAGWLDGDTIHNDPANGDLGSSSTSTKTNFYWVVIKKPGVAVKAWGLSDSRNIANANWLQDTASTNFLCYYDYYQSAISPVYLYVWLKWMRYSLKFDSNGGSVMSDLSDICYTNSIALPEPSRTGYDFEGWTNSTLTAVLNGSKTGSDLGVADDGTTNITLYAKWTPKTFEVTFDKNGDGDAVSPATVNVTYDATYGELPTPIWLKHTFDGWFTQASDGEQVTADTTVSITNAQTLYAHWTEIPEYSVIFYNTDSTELLSTNVTEGTMLTPPAITLGANEYLEWWYDGTDNHNPNQLIEVKGNMNLRPRIQIRQATLTLKCSPESGGSAELVEGSWSGDAGRSVKVAAVPSEIYMFSGWSDGVSELTNTVVLVTNTTLTANFSKRRFDVSFVDWDGVTSLSKQTVEYGDAAVAPDDPANREGYTFTEWSVNYSNVTSDMTVVAQYEANRYTVDYDANRGGGTMTNDVFTYDQECNLQPNAYTRALHAFLGWSSKPDAATNEVEYVDRAIVSNLTAVANGTNTLYAVWQSLLSDYSLAADCTNLILVCTNVVGSQLQKWDIDDTMGSASPSSIYACGADEKRSAFMTTAIEGTGTLTFQAKGIRKSSGTSPLLGLYNGEMKSLIESNDTGDKWVSHAYCKTDAALDTLTWFYYGRLNAEACWVDQVHWYPNRFVEVESYELIDEEKKNAVKEAILQAWDVILGANATNVSQVEATGADVTNAVALIAGGIMPDVAIDGATATLTFRNDGEVRKVSVEVPSIESVAYTGEPQTATIPDSSLYEVVLNAGGTTAGVYSVVLKLADTNIYCWAGGDSNPTSLTFTITQATNEWKVEPSMAGWTAGETPSEPNMGEAKFGTVVVTYGELGAVCPTDPGNYVATFTVDETDNYTGLTKVVPFSIVSAGEMSAAEKAFEGWPVMVAPDGSGGWKVTLTNDIDDANLPIEIPDNLGSVTIDLNGHDLLGGEGQPAIRIKPGEGDGELTVLTINGSGSTVQGGEGAPAIVAADGAKDGVTVNVGAGVTLEGGGVPAIDGAEIGTNEGNIQKVDVTVPTVAGKEYNGQRQTADVSEGPYTVTDEGGTDVGDYSVTLTLVDTNSYCWAGGDSNPTSLTFTITGKDIAAANIELGPSLKYTGEEQTQTVQRVTIDGLDVTYAVSGNAATETGSYTLTVVGSGNFKGSATAAWTIYPDLPPSPWSIDTDGTYNPLVANVYDGYILDNDGALAGIIQVKAAKQTVKTTTDRATGEKTVTTNVAVTATVTDTNGKKWSYSKGVGTVEGVVTGLVCTTKGVLVSPFGVTLGANGLSGEWGEHHAIVGARNGMGTKDDPMKADLDAYYKKSWSVTFTNEFGATRLQLVVVAKGSTKISGVTPDGFKVTATVQGIMGEDAFFVPYLATLKNGTLTRPANLLLMLGKAGAVDALTSDLGVLKAAGPTTDEIAVQPYAESALSKGGEVYAGAVVLNDLAYPAKFAAKGLPAGLKIDAATGAITGTPTKPGHYVATVTITSGINTKAKKETVVEFDIKNYTDEAIKVEDSYSGYCVGVKVYEPIAAAIGCNVSGLPAGLKFAAKETKDATFGVVPAGTVYGVPTKAVTNTVYFKKSEKGTNELGKVVTVNHQASATFVIDPLPAWAQGTFDGAVQDLGVASPSGLVTFTVSAAGKVSGKLLRDGLSWTLAAAAYDSVEGLDLENLENLDNLIFHATVIGKSGKVAFTNEVTVSAEALGDSMRGIATGDGLTAWQNLWKTEPWKTVAKPFANKTLEVGEVTFKFASSGAVTAKYGTYSCSSVLIPQGEIENGYTVYLYFPPKAGKFDGYTAVVPLVWDGANFSLRE